MSYLEPGSALRASSRLTLGAVGLLVSLNAVACGGTTTGSGGVGGTGTATATVTVTEGATSGTGGPGDACDTGNDCLGGPKSRCIHADNLCGSGVKGVCTKCNCGAGEGCENNGVKYCGCDGTISVSSFDCGQFDYSKDASICSKGTFPCGATQCKLYVEYCSSTGMTGTCAPAPAACSLGLARCACVKNSPGAMCTDDGQGAVTTQCALAGAACGADTPCCVGAQCRKGVCQACESYGTACSPTGEDLCCAQSPSGATACAPTATAGAYACTGCVGDGGTPMASNGVTPPCCCSTPFDAFTNTCHALPNGPGAACDKSCLCASGTCDATGHCQ